MLKRYYSVIKFRICEYIIYFFKFLVPYRTGTEEKLFVISLQLYRTMFRYDKLFETLNMISKIQTRYLIYLLTYVAIFKGRNS